MNLKDICILILLAFTICYNLFSQLPEFRNYSKKEGINIMSEFTSGFIAMNTDEQRLKEELSRSKLKYKIKEMNRKWIYFFIEIKYHLHIDSFQPLLDISKKITFMYFYNAEDHGWGYKIFNNGKIVSSVDITYISEYVFDLTMQKAEKKYPNIDVFQELLVNPDRRDEWNKIENDIKESDDYNKDILALVTNMIKNKNIDVFKLLNVNKNTIDHLNAFISIDTFLNAADELALVQEFKSILNINDFNWVSYEYLNDQNDL